MTAVTGSPAADQSGRGTSGGVRGAAQSRSAAAQSGAVGDALSSAGNQAPAKVVEPGRTVVPRPRPAALAAVISDGSATTFAAVANRPSPQAGTAARSGFRDASDQVSPAVASLVHDGPEWSAEARVEALTGGERAVLLTHIARAYPDVVEAGFELVAQWRAECAERRRGAGRERRKRQRRRQRAEAGNRG